MQYSFGRLIWSVCFFSFLGILI
uniref:Uncharacterized protein n=1 Tax=Arundo donax TaxID=35708 RepID=A0A0A9EV15_ARUDO